MLSAHPSSNPHLLKHYPLRRVIFEGSSRSAIMHKNSLGTCMQLRFFAALELLGPLQGNVILNVY
jgi:hypothetical protein